MKKILRLNELLLLASKTVHLVLESENLIQVTHRRNGLQPCLTAIILVRLSVCQTMRNESAQSTRSGKLDEKYRKN